MVAIVPRPATEERTPMNDSHQHEWNDTTEPGQNPRTYACTTCDQTTAGCSECGRALTTSLTICDRCLTRAQQLVTDVIDAINTVPFHFAEIMGLRAVRYDRDIVTTSNDRDRLPFGLDAVIEDPSDARIAAAKHPNTALEILHGWAHAWADTRGDIDHGLQYLVDHTLWAAQNPDDSGWHAYLDEARQVRATVRRLLGLDPIHEPAPCVYCSGPVIREWLPDGLDDTRRCTRCGTTWPDEERLRYTNRHTVFALPETHPDALVTADDARRILPDLKRNTLNQALKRDRDRPDDERRIPQHGADVRGHALYRLGDIAQLITAGAAA